MQHFTPTLKSKIKVFGIFISLFLLLSNLQAQTYLINEDFSTASGSTPPTGWTVQTVVGDAGVDVWHFDNPGRRTGNSPISEPFASFDSDSYSDNGLAEEIYLISPVFNGTTLENIYLEFDHYFEGGYGGEIAVEVFNGTSWVSIYSTTSTTNNPQSSSFDITTHVQNVTNAQIRFKWIGNYSWYWIVDNIQVELVSATTEQFTEQTALSLTRVGYSSIEWGDYDNDDDLDLLLTGYNGSNVSKIYKNNGDNSFTEQTDISLTGVSESSVTWGDYDNDGNLDILLTGSIDDIYGEAITKIYKNNGDNTFTEQTDIHLPGVSSSSVVWFDYDNDGNLDILLTGSYISKIFKNNGDNSFTEQTSISLIGITNGAIDCADYDNDQDLDILLTGYSSSGIVSKIYKNNGDNSFTEQTGISLTGVYTSSVAWGDYDNDGNLDILLTGRDASDNRISKIYKNNGDNTFTEQTGISLTGVNYSSVAWGDYDNNGYLDILLTGYTGTGYVSIVYKNNGDNTFSEQTDVSLTMVNLGSVKWSDYDNDGDLDIHLTGKNVSSYFSKVYKNNSVKKNSKPTSPNNLSTTVTGQKITFQFNEAIDMETPQESLTYNLFIGSEENRQDIFNCQSNLLTGVNKRTKMGNIGTNNNFVFNSELPAGTYYWGIQTIDNIYAGSEFSKSSFTITDTQAAQVAVSNITAQTAEISWLRGNNENCIVFIKKDGTDIPDINNNTEYIYDNQFSKGSRTNNDWYCVYKGFGTSVEINGLTPNSNYKVMVLEFSGETGEEQYLLYTNPSNSEIFDTKEFFTTNTESSMFDRSQAGASSDIGDYNNDGFLDIIASGGGEPTFIYKNNGDGTFTEQTSIDLGQLTNGSVSWGDYNNDDFLDIIISGTTGAVDDASTKIFKNNGDNTFSEQNDIFLEGVSYSSIAWGDYDNDGFIDILLSGRNISGTPVSKIYKNDRIGGFVEQTNIVLTGVKNSSVAWGDYNNDGFLDILLTGEKDGFWGQTSKIYKNDGNGSFLEQTSISIQKAYDSSVDWGDYDNDGFLDIIINGRYKQDFSPYSDVYLTNIYRNNQGNGFVKIEDTDLYDCALGVVKWVDYNNDGFLDIYITGKTDTNSYSYLYNNDKNGSFIIQPEIELSGMQQGSSVWGDYDLDSDLDLLTFSVKSGIYTNNTAIKNTPPFVPQDLAAYIDNGRLYLSWDKSTDAETPQLALTYNLRVGTTPGGCEIMSPMSLTNGKRLIPAMGNVQMNTSWVINLPTPLPENIYYSVQAIDNGFLASEWSPEQSNVSKFVADFEPTTVCQKNDITFEDKSYSIDYEITSWQWKFTEGSTITESSLQAPTYSFQTTGSHSVELTITNSNNETTTRTKTVNVLPSPLSDFTVSTVCEGTLTPISNTTDANSTSITSWSWDFGDGSPLSTDYNPATHSYNPGTYNLSLTTTSDNGCSLTTTKQVTVEELPSKTVSIIGASDYCANENTMIYVDNNPDYTYQWLASGATIQDSTKYRLYPKYSDTYSVKITNTLAPDCFVESNTKALTVKPSPDALTILAPTGTSYCKEDPNSELSAANVAGLNYTWQTDGNVAVSGEGLNTFTPTQTGTFDYTLKVTNSDGCSSISTNTVSGISILPIPEKPNLTSSATEFCEGESVNMETPYSDVLTYQWLKSGIAIDNATQNSFSPTTSGDYAVRITENGCSNTSQITSINVLPTPDVPVIIADGLTTFCKGNNVNLSVENLSELTYLWKRDGAKLASTTYTSAASITGAYTVEVTNTNNCTQISAPLSVTVYDLPAMPSIDKSGATEFCEGESVTLSVVDNPDFTYQWLKDGANANNTTNSFNSNETGNYTLKITNQNNCFDITEPIVVNVLSTPSVPTIQADGVTEFCKGNNVNLSVENLQELTYLWKRDGAKLASTTYTSPASITGAYTVEVTNTNNCTQISAPLSVTVYDLPAMPSIDKSGATEFCEGESVTLSVTNNTDFTYQWLKDGANVDNTTNSFNSNETGNYTLKITNQNNCFDITAPIAVNVLSTPSIPIIQADGQTEFCKGTSINLSVENLPELTYLWKRDGAKLASTTYTSPASITGAYTVEVTNTNNCTQISAPLSVTVYDLPAMPSIDKSGATEFCEGESVTLSVTNNTDFTYQWLKDGANVDNTTNSFNSNETGNYTLKITNQNNCFDITEPIVVNVLSTPSVPTIQADGVTEFCKGNSVNLSVENLQELTYLWKRDGAKLASTTYTSPASITGAYTVEVTNTNNCTQISAPLSVTVYDLPAMPSIDKSGATEFCEGESVTLSVSNNTDFTYQWLKDGAVTGTATNSFVANQAGDYTLKITNQNNCFVESSPITITTLASPPPISITALSATEFCRGESVVLQAPKFSEYHYQWQYNEGNTGVTTTEFTAKYSGDYMLRLSNSIGCSTLSANKINVNVVEPPDNLTITLTQQPVICPGEEIKLSVENVENYSYQWYKDNELIENAIANKLTANTGGTYHVKVNNSLCSGESSPQSIVEKTGLPIPEVYLRGPAFWYMAVSEMSATQYKWFVNDEEIPESNHYQYFADQQHGKYHALLTDGGECWTKSPVVNIPEDFGKFKSFNFEEIKKKESETGLSIFPNPNTGEFTLQFDSKYTGNIIIKLYDLSGNEIYHQKIDKQARIFEQKLSINQKGAIFVKIKTANKEFVKQMVVE